MVDTANTNFISMFREYDIRGHVSGEELNPESVALIVSAYAEYLKRRDIWKAVVGYDSRECSPAFAEAANAALTRRGIDVLFIGLATTPLVYFAQYFFDCKGAVMITASHNPNGWSGFKMGKDFSETLEPDDIKELFTLARDLSDTDDASRQGSIEHRDVRDAYINAIVSRIHMGPKPPRIVLDAANGGAGVFVYEVFQRLGCMTFQLYCDPDVAFPNYFPNPSELKARERVRELVRHPYVQADLGVGFDGDGDRMGVVDEKGDNIWSDTILAVLAKQLLEKTSGQTVVYDVKCSKTLEETILNNGGTPFMWKTGHSHIKAKMHELGAPLAGERSGHIFIGGDDWYGFDDAIFSAAKLVEYLSWQKKTLSEIIAEFPQYVTSPEIKAYCADTEKYIVVERLTKLFKELYPGKVNETNGARVNFDIGWGLVRASSNMPELVLIFEGKTYKDMKGIHDRFREILRDFPEIDRTWENGLV